MVWPLRCLARNMILDSAACRQVEGVGCPAERDSWQMYLRVSSITAGGFLSRRSM